MVTTKTLTLLDFFVGIFPACYVCAMKEGHGQINGQVPSSDLNTLESLEEWADQYIRLNQQGYNIFFTPNGLKDGATSNKEENFSHINAWWVDVDIDETKIISGTDEERELLLSLRQEKKAEILKKFFQSKLPLPSLLNETRNGYQAIWFSLDGTKAKFETIQKALVKEFDGDPAASHLTSMLRLPEMNFYKKGEVGVITPQFTWSTCQLVSEAEMLTKIVFIPPEVKKIHIYSTRPIIHTTGHGIWDKIDAIPISQQLSILSGSWLVNGEILTIKKNNVFSNNNPTPVWVNHSTNSIFSNNYKGMKSILQFCQWYGHEKAKITEALKILFNL